MLKFARHHPSPTGGCGKRSSSVDRGSGRATEATSASVSRPAVSQSRKSRTSSLERSRNPQGGPAGDAVFTRGTTLPSPPPLTSPNSVKTATVISATSYSRTCSPPPPLPEKSFSPKIAKKELESKEALKEISPESNYEAIFSGTLCRVTLLQTPVRYQAKEIPKPLNVKKDSYVNNNLYEPRSDFHRAVVRLVEKLDLQLLDTSSESGYGSDQDSLNSLANVASPGASDSQPPPLPSRGSKLRVPSNGKEKKSVRFDSYVMLLQGLRERSLELVQTHIRDVCDEALATEEVVNEFLTAVIEGNEPIIREMLANGFNVNASDPAGMTPLHLAATFNNLPLVRLLLSHGAGVFSRTHSSGNIPSELSSRRLPGFQACHAYLRCMEECLGVANSGKVFVTQPYRTCRCDELGVVPGETLTVIRKGDYPGSSWWWCMNPQGMQGYVLKDLLALNKPTAVR